MDFSETPIRQLIPQRPPFLFVDRVVSCDEVDAHTEYRVAEDSIMVDDGRLSAPGIIENMAQSCAARMGCMDVLHGEPVKIGYIGDVRDAEIAKLPRCGQTLHTHIKVTQEVFNLLLANVTVEADGELIATASVKVAKTDMVANLVD